MRSSKTKVTHEDTQTILNGSCLFDDFFMQLCFDGSPQVAEVILRIVLNMPGLTVKTLKTQEKVPGVGVRTVCFDILAQDADGTWYNIEIQRDARGASPGRARYYSSALDVHLSEAGEKFDTLPKAIVVFITETDVLGYGRPVYNISRVIDGIGAFDDGAKIVYVNGAWCGDDDIGRLMADFSQSDPAKMHYKVLASRVQGVKSPEVVNTKGENMSEEARKVLDKYTTAWFADGKREGKQEGIQETARAMLAERIPLDTIVRCTGLTQDEVVALK